MALNNSVFVISFQDGSSALMLASGNGRTETVKYLINAKASVDLQGKVYFHQLVIIDNCCMLPRMF